MQGKPHLCDSIHRPRILAYLLACLILLQLEASNYVYGWVAFLLAYPLAMRRLMVCFNESNAAARRSMLVDAALVGLLISLVDLNFEASVILATLLTISIGIVGGGILLLMATPLLLLGVGLGYLLHPVREVGDSSFYYLSFLALAIYIFCIGALVYRETRRLLISESRLARNRAHLAAYLPGGLPVRPHPERKPLTVMFSDIQGFTSLMDKSDEAMVADFLNAYFTEMTDIAERHGGTIDKFMGDGLMVFFGDPGSRGEVADAAACVAMAVEMRARFRVLTRAWIERTGELRLRVGIHSGHCLVGDFGSSKRKDYTAMGGTVNRASRLESMAAPDEILISEQTWRLARPGVIARARGELRLRGVAVPLSVFSVQALSGPPADGAGTVPGPLGPAGPVDHV